MRSTSPRPGPRRAAEHAVRRIAAALLLLAAAAVSPALAGWWDDAAEARETTLHELRRDPARWRDVPVLLRARFGGAGPRHNPFFTQFTPERWQAVSLVADRAPRTGDAPAQVELATAFVARGGRDDLRLARLNPNLPVLVRAVVRDEVSGEPWIEVLSFTVDGDPLTPEEATRVREADRFLEARNPTAAERLYRGVLAGRKLADRDRADLLRRVGVALHDQRRPEAALAAFREALALHPDDAEARSRVTQLEQALARAPLAPSPEGVPPTAGSAAPTPPPLPEATEDAPLLLPGRTPRLAPPGGLEGRSVERPEAGTQEDTAKKDPGTAEPAARSSGTQAAETRPVEARPGSEKPKEDEAKEDVPPPVPPPARLSGPK